MPYEVRLTLFIVLTIISALVFLVVFLYQPVRRHLYRNYPVRMFYRTVMQTAKDGDFYLLNNLQLKLDKNDYVKIDHLLGGDKYIYVITDRYYEGAINVKPDDLRWIYYERDGGKRYISNPLLENKAAMERLSIVSGIQTSFMVGIVIVNNDCFVNRFAADDAHNLLVSERKFEKIVNTFEAQPVKPFVKEELWQCIQDLHNLRSK